MLIKQKMLIWVLPFILLVVSIPFVLPSLVESYLTYSLQSDGLTDVQVDIDHIGLNTMRVGKIRFNYLGEEHRAEVIASKIALRYNMASLMSGQVNAIDIKTLNVLVNKNTDPIRVARELKNSFSLPLLDDIPFQSLQLTKARVIVRGESRDDIKFSAAADVKKQNDILKAKLDIERVDYAVMHVSMDYQRNGRVALSLREANQEVPLLDLQAERVLIAQQMVDAAVIAQVDFSKLGVFFKTLGLLSEVEGIAGKMDVNANLKIPINFSMSASQWLEESRLEVQMNLDVQAQRLPGLGNNLIAKIPLTLSIKDGHLNWHFAKGTRVKMMADLSMLTSTGGSLAWLTTAEGQQVLDVSLPQGLSGQVGNVLDAKKVNTGGQQLIRIDYGKSETLFNVTLKVESPTLLADQDWSLKSNISYRLEFPQLKKAEIRALKMKGNGGFLLTKNKAQLDLNADSSMTLATLKNEALTLQGVDVSLTEPTRCLMNFERKTWRCDSLAARFSVTDITTPDMTFKFKHGMFKLQDLNNDAGTLFLRARVDLIDNTVAMKDTTLKLDKFWFDAVLKKSRLHGQLHLELARSALLLDGKYQHNLLTSHGELEYRVKEVDLSANTAVLAKLVTRPVLPLQLSDGKFSSNGHVSWKPANKQQQQQITGKAVFVLQALKGKVKNSDFNRLSTRMAVSINAEGFGSEPAIVTLDSINPGVEVSDIKFMLSGYVAGDKKPRLRIDKLTASALDGTLASDEIHLDLNKANNPFVIRFKELSLSRLLELEKDQGLSGSGVIDGVLPFDYKTGEGLFMQKGNIFARDPGGLLQYQATERVQSLAKSNPNIKLLLDALNNFNYNKLKADASYTPNGKLDLNVLLQGSNPDFQRGRAVHFNVNVEENILQLMRSLQLGDEIGERLGDRILKQKQ